MTSQAKKTDNNLLQIVQLEEKIQKQQETITELKRLVVELGDKVVKDEEENKNKKEEEKVSGINYWDRSINPCNKNNFYVCAVCEQVPNVFHILKIRTCSVECSTRIESMLTIKPVK